MIVTAGTSDDGTGLEEKSFDAFDKALPLHLDSLENFQSIHRRRDQAKALEVPYYISAEPSNRCTRWMKDFSQVNFANFIFVVFDKLKRLTQNNSDADIKIIGSTF